MRVAGCGTGHRVASRATRRLRNALGLLALVGLAACTGTRLNVVVEATRGQPLEGAHVDLLYPDEICALRGAAITDARGVAHVSREDCGSMTLVVGAPGHVTLREPIDTCERRRVRVALHAAPRPAAPQDACAQAALELLRAWAADDLAAMQPRFVDPEVAAAHRRRARDPAPWQVAVERGSIAPGGCKVRASVFYDAGCHERWQLELHQIGEAWRVQRMTREGYVRDSSFGPMK